MRILAFVLALAALACAEVEADIDEVLFHYRLYVDAGYIHSSTRPENGIWRSKVTDFRLDQPEVNLAMALLSKRATAQSRWGFEVGIQAGVDTELAVSADNPIGGADVLQYIHRASLSYLFDAGNGLSLTAGLLPGTPGYESFLSIDNPTYTRGYITDNVPYFLIGIDATYKFNPALDASVLLVTGWDYLIDRNDAPSVIGKTVWRVNERFTYSQTLYWGPDQANTDVEFWRFFSDSILEYKSGPITVAFVFDIGTEKQAEVAGNPRGNWFAAAFWLKWEIDEHWSLGLRPEFYDDSDGVISGSRQQIGDISVALKYRYEPAHAHTLVFSLEYRYDRSTGPEGGFFAGPDNTLVSEQHLIMLAVNWSFEGDFGGG